MSKNTALSGLAIDDFSRLHSIAGIETASNLKEFSIGNAVWDKAVIESFMPLSNTKIEKLSFTGKSISDNDYSFLSSMPNLKTFDFDLNFLTTEQVAWIVANFPHLQGFALKAKEDCMMCRKDSDTYEEVPSTIIVGKGKPALNIAGNESKIQKYELQFEKLKEQYKGKKYRDLFVIKQI